MDIPWRHTRIANISFCVISSGRFTFTVSKFLMVNLAIGDLLMGKIYLNGGAYSNPNASSRRRLFIDNCRGGCPYDWRLLQLCH